MRLTSWHVMKDTDWRTHGWQVWQTAGTISCVTFTLLNAACSLSLFPLFLSVFLSLPQTSPYTRTTLHPHTHYPSHPSLCAYVYTPIQTQRWINFTFPFRMRKMPCLIVSSWHDVWFHLMLLCKSAYCCSFFVCQLFFFLYGFILLWTIISPPQMLHLVTYFWKWGRSFFCCFFWQGTAKTITKLTNWKKSPHCVVV